MASDDMGEKTEDATPKRRQEARDEGKVAKSTDFGAVFMLIAGMLVIFISTGMMFERGARMVRASLEGDSFAIMVDPGEIPGIIALFAREAAWAIAPVLGFIFLSAVIGQISQVGLLFAPKSIKPSLNKISPIAGVKRLFSLTSLAKAALDILKITIISIVAILTIKQYESRLLGLAELEVVPGLLSSGWIIVDFTIRVVIVLILIGVADLTFQRWKYKEDMKMTKQQVKDEFKNADGDPEVKKRRMRMAQQIAMQRVNTAVPTADVIVTNPEHYSIAIRYDQETMVAPVVVAKGVDSLAMRIRQIAMRNDIPIVERPPLARGLYRDVEVGGPIPEDFFTAVAEVLAYVYQLEGRTVAT